jgi:hypothetical protein
MTLPENGSITLPTLLVRCVLALLFFGALVSGVLTYRNLRDLSSTYAAAPPDLRRFMLYGPLAPMIAQVEARVPAHSSILFISDADPALVAYALLPRKIWQTSVDQALQPMFMESNNSLYPERRPESFAVDWVLSLTPENFAQGGELLPVQRGEH